MGAIAKCIKRAAASRTNEERARLRQRLKRITEEAAQTSGAADLARMSAAPAAGGPGLPTSAEETRRNMLKWLAIIGGTALGAGALSRLWSVPTEAARRRRLLAEFDPYAGVSTREMRVPLPLKAAAVKTAGWLDDLWSAAVEKGRETRERLFARTGKPWQSPYFLPAATVGTMLAAYMGYKGTDAVIDALRRRRLNRRLRRARREFELSLGEQYRQAKTADASGDRPGIGAAVDVLARAHESGELAGQLQTMAKSGQDFDPTKVRTKWWHGAGHVPAGTLLAMLTLLGTLGLSGGYLWVKRHEERRRKYEAAKDILRRRQLAEPLKALVESIPSA